jgi:integrase/recombinase XerD
MYTKRTGGLFGKSKRPKKKKYKKEPVPFDKVGPLIDSAKSYRDKAMYSLLAASGSRQHEAYQLRLRDIDFENRTVLLVDPETRDNSDLSEEEFEALDWKGRATEKTFLIEPFKTMFFENLMLYVKNERIAHGLHDFAFQKEGGRPYFLTTRSTRSEAFNSCKKKVGLGDAQLISIHSLRHTYGSYALNYLPTESGFGLPITTVKLLMGHELLASTEIYAKKDEDLVEAQIEFANQQVFGLGKQLSLKDIQLRYHQSEIDRLMDTKILEQDEGQ